MSGNSTDRTVVLTGGLSASLTAGDATVKLTVLELTGDSVTVLVVVVVGKVVVGSGVVLEWFAKKAVVR